DQELVVVDLELGPGVLRVQDLLTDGNVDRLALAFAVERAGADGQDLALLGLLLGGVREHDARLRHLLTRGGLDDDAVAQRAGLRLRLRGGGQRAILLWQPRTGRRWPGVCDRTRRDGDAAGGAEASGRVRHQGRVRPGRACREALPRERSGPS